MTDRALIVCASRDRPNLLRDMIHSFKATSTKADLAVYVDDDQGGPYLNAALGAHMIVGPRIGPCAALNALVKAHPGYAVYGAVTDDALFENDGWDQWALTAAAGFPNGIGLLAPITHMHGRMDFPWATAGWIDVVGDLCYPGTHHFYWDVALELLGESLGLIRYATRDECTLIHLEAGPSPVPMDEDAPLDIAQCDAATQKALAHAYADAKIVCAWAAHSRKPMLAKLKEAITCAASSPSTA